MAVVRRPPPIAVPNPIFYTLPAGSALARVYNPTSYGATPLTFRRFGPLLRFDHQTRKGGKPWLHPKRGIYYAGFTLSCCIVEVFGDEGEIEFGNFHAAEVETTRDLRLLDLRGSGAMRAGSIAALCAVPDRRLSQLWGAYFYRTAVYQNVDGLVYPNAHNGEDAVALYERAEAALVCSPASIFRLDDPVLEDILGRISVQNNLRIGT